MGLLFGLGMLAMVAFLGYLVVRAKHQDELNMALAWPSALPVDSDPAFARHFTHIKQAWSNRDLNPIAYTLSDGQYSAFHSSLLLNRARGIRNEMAQLKVISHWVLRQEQIGAWQTQTVEFTAFARDQYWNAKTGVLLKEQAGEFSEVWTYIQKANPNSDSRPVDSAEDKCPQCGHSVNLRDAPVCPACKLSRRSGYCGWVLTKISTKPAYLSRRRAHPVEIPLSQNEVLPSNLIENRATALFWRFALGRLTGGQDTLKQSFQGLVTATFEWEKALALELGEEDFAVGDVDYWGMKSHAPDTHSPVEFLINISYSFQLPSGQRENRMAYMNLIRQESGRELCLDSLSCNQCGAARGFEEQCGYCGTPWPQSHSEWLIASLE